MIENVKQWRIVCMSPRLVVQIGMFAGVSHDHHYVETGLKKMQKGMVNLLNLYVVVQTIAEQ